MNALPPILCSIAAPGVEVITHAADEGPAPFLTIVHGGILDGEEYPSSDLAAARRQHQSAVRLAGSAILEAQGQRQRPAA